MREFFKMMLASMVGFVIAMFIFSMIMIIMLAAAISLAPGDEVQVPDKALLHVKLDMPIQERVTNSPFDALAFMGETRPLGLNQIVRNIERAAKDDRIKGIYLEMGMMQTGMATLEEIRNALITFRASGKPVIAYGDQVSQSAYYLATSASEIYVNPLGMIDFSGLSAQVAFVKGLSAKLKVEMQIIRPANNTYKSAVEPFILDRMSEANREQTGRYLQSGWDHMLKGIEQERGLGIVRLNEMADSLIAFKPARAVAYGLIDGTMYQDELNDSLKAILGNDQKKGPTTISLAKYIKADDKEKHKGEKKGDERIAIVYATGNIVMGDAEEMVISATHISKTIRKAREDKKVKAIVLRVNSPGGDGLASEIIWREVALAVKEKPVVVSMGDYAASGGYYIACAATTIVAQPNTLTGSIGVFGVIPNMQKLFSEHLGITFEEVNTNKNSNLGNVMRPLSPYEYTMLQGYVDDFYGHFISRVAEGRKLSLAGVDSIAQGRVWSGADAVKIGLVDEIGGLEDAVKIAAGEAGLKSWSVVEWPAQTDPLTRMFRQLSGESSMQATLRKQLGTNYALIEMLTSFGEMRGIQARIPFIMTIQ
jgi:protease IV